MADDAQRLKVITDNIEASYQALRKAAANIAGLVQVGRATCDEVKAYNLWALAIYNTQRGMLNVLRQNGQQVPDLPPAPTLFAWRGVQGIDAVKMNCSGETKSLSGLMGAAMRGPSDVTPFLSSNEIEVVTQDQFAFNPEAAPSFKTLLDLQAQREAEKHAGVAGLGISVGVIILVAGLVITVTAVAIVAIMSYLKTNSIQEANTKQVKLQADAFANYTAARLACYSQCTGSGKSSEQCVEICRRIVDKPDIKLPGQGGSWGALQWIGAIVVVGLGAVVAWRIWRHYRHDEPLFELPESTAEAIHTTTAAA